jgi:hypothetical protein
MGYVGKHHASTLSGGRRILVVVLAALSGSLIAVGLQGDLGRVDSPTAPQAGLSTSTMTLLPLHSPTSRSKDVVGSKVWPVHLRIPAIKVSADVTGLGLNVDRSIEVPRNPDAAGWYRLGPSPGRSGAAVILGHVDSTHGPAVFFHLRNLKPGNRIAVRLSDAAVAHFQVTRVASYANRDFPARKVYGGAVGDRPTLNLVTCGGKYDREAGGYQSNVVVYATYLWATDASSHPEVIARPRVL